MQNTDHVGLVYALLMYLEKAHDGERFKINRTIRQLQAELDHDIVDCGASNVATTYANGAACGALGLARR